MIVFFSIFGWTITINGPITLVFFFNILFNESYHRADREENQHTHTSLTCPLPASSDAFDSF